MLEFNELDVCFECVNCGQRLGEDQVKDGAEQGWQHCPGCGDEVDFEKIHEDHNK